MFKITRLSSEKEVKGLVDAINKLGKPQALDVETTGLDPRRDQILSIIITGPGSDTAYAFPRSIAAYLSELQVGLILHNFKFDYHFLYKSGIDLLNHDFRDTMLIHHLIDENNAHSLDSLVKAKYNDNYKEVFWNTYKTLQDAPQRAQDEYAGRDVIYTLKLYYELLNEFKVLLLPDSLLKEVHRFASALLVTEIEGVCIDLNVIKDKGISTLRRISELKSLIIGTCKPQITKIEESIWISERDKRKTDRGKSGVKRPDFNLNSTAQLQRLLYQELKLPIQRSNLRKPTVDDGALAKLEDLHPAIPLLREYRENEKLFTAFLEAAVDKSVNGRIYPSFNVNGTVTGRISASNPNLQQLPAAGGIRSMYVPQKGCVFISADYSQLEVTLAAHFSKDPQLLRVVHEGISLHDITAEGLGIDRKVAKTINFAIQYGAGVGKIQKILKCSRQDAEVALNKYWETYPGLKALVDKCHYCVDQGLAITNPFGRQRHLSIKGLTDKWEIAAVKRQAFNSLIQGTGADITNRAFTKVHEELMQVGEGRGLFVVHDEVLIEVLDKRAEYWNTRLVQIMGEIPSQIPLSVPLHAQPSGPMLAWND